MDSIDEGHGLLGVLEALRPNLVTSVMKLNTQDPECTSWRHFTQSPKDLPAVDNTTFVQELKGQDPEDRPLLDSNTAARIIEIIRKASCQIGESEECEDFDSILGIIFDYVVQQRERNSIEATSPDLKFLLDANLIHALSDVYLSLFPQIGTVGPIAERTLDCLFKTMLCIFEEHSPAKREFANRCLPRMYQDWFAPGYNAHPAAVYHMMEVVEALFTDDEILNRFWLNHDAATEKARLLLRFAFEQSLVLFSLINKCRLNHSKNSFLEEAISLENITSIPKGVTSKDLCEAFQYLRHRGANTIDDPSLNKIAKQLLKACKIVYRPYNVATLWLNTNEFFVRHFEITRRGLSALIVPQSDPELEPEFLFTDRRALPLEHHKDQRTVILTLSAPLHPCVAKHFEDSEDDDSAQDTSVIKGRGTKGEDSKSMLIMLEFKSDEIAEEFSASFQAQSTEDDFSMSQRSDVPRNIRPNCGMKHV